MSGISVTTNTRFFKLFAKASCFQSTKTKNKKQRTTKTNNIQKNKEYKKKITGKKGKTSTLQWTALRERCGY